MFPIFSVLLSFAKNRIKIIQKNFVFVVLFLKTQHVVSEWSKRSIRKHISNIEKKNEKSRSRNKKIIKTKIKT